MPYLLVRAALLVAGNLLAVLVVALLADEPTGNLDSRMGDEIVGILEDLNRKDETTVVMVTHDPRMAARTARTVRLFDGRLVN